MKNNVWYWSKRGLISEINMFFYFLMLKKNNFLKINVSKANIKDADFYYLFLKNIHIVTNNDCGVIQSLLIDKELNFIWFWNDKLNEININDHRKLLKEHFVYSDHLLDMVHEYKLKLSLPEDYISLHIRGGDKLHRESKKPNLKKIKNLIRKQNIRNVYLSTDDLIYYHEMKKFCEQNDYRFYSSKPLNNSYQQSEFDNLSEKIKKEQLIYFLTQLKIHFDSNCAICSLESNVGRIIYLMNKNTISYDVDFRHFFDPVRESSMNTIKYKLKLIISNYLSNYGKN